jgi:The ARF-like 2 binding protein BART
MNIIFADEEVFLEQSGSSEDNEFDFVVGALEDIVMSDEFNALQKGFFEEHCGEFLSVLYCKVLGWY